MAIEFSTGWDRIKTAARGRVNPLLSNLDESRVTAALREAHQDVLCHSRVLSVLRAAAQDYGTALVVEDASGPTATSRCTTEVIELAATFRAKPLVVQLAAGGSQGYRVIEAFDF